MKKLLTIIATLLITVKIYATEIPEFVKIGLQTQYANQSDIVVKNKELYMYYNNEAVLAEFDAKNNFVFKPSNKYYIGVKAEFASYEDALVESELYNTGVVAYVGETDFKVYVGGYEVREEAEELLELATSRNPEKEHFVIESADNRLELYEGPNRLLLIDSKLDQPTFKTEDVIVLQHHEYRGYLELRRYNEKGLLPVNVVNIEEYLKGVVPAEMSSKWELEALKTQAVAARNYAIQKLGRHENHGYDLCDTEHCQVYKGFDYETEKTNKAVEDSKGYLLYYGNEVIPTYYSASSGGHTEDSNNVWGNVSYAYLKGVPDIYEDDDVWERHYTADELEDRFEYYFDGEKIGTIIDVIPKEMSKSGRLIEVEIKGTRGSKTLRKSSVRTFFPRIERNDNKSFKSAKFIVKLANGDYSTNLLSEGAYQIGKKLKDFKMLSAGRNTKSISKRKDKVVHILGANDNRISSKIEDRDSEMFIFQGRGYGHGVGMSQVGANAFAKNGYTFDQILTYYFTGTEVRENK